MKRLVCSLVGFMILFLAACSSPPAEIQPTASRETLGVEATTTAMLPTVTPELPGSDTNSENPVTQMPGSDLLCTILSGGSAPDWSLCRSQKYAFEVQYPPEGKLVDQTADTARINLPFTTGTNLTEKYLEVAVREKIDPCSSPLAEGYAPGTIRTEPVQFNGLEFKKETGQEGAAGSIYSWVAYSISRENRCISLSFVLRSFHPELKPTPPPIFDLEEESKIFSEIVSTFTWLEPSNHPPTQTN